MPGTRPGSSQWSEVSAFEPGDVEKTLGCLISCLSLDKKVWSCDWGRVGCMGHEEPGEASGRCGGSVSMLE